MKRFILYVLFLGMATALQAQNLNDARYAIELKQFSKAVGILDNLIAASPANAELYYHKGTAYFQNSLYDSAQASFESGISANANNPYNYIGLGGIALHEKDMAKAHRQFEKALSLAGASKPAIQHEVAYVYASLFSRRDAAYALPLIEEAVKAEPKNKLYRITYGDLLRMNDRSGEGKKQYEAALAIDKNYALAHLRIGQMWMSAGRKDLAKESFEQVRSIDPSYAPVHAQLGEYYYQTSDGQKALEHYRRFIELVGNSINERVKYASYLYATEKYSDAIAELEQVRKLDPKHVYMLKLLGLSYQRTNNPEEGIKAWAVYFAEADSDYINVQDYQAYGSMLAQAGQDSLALHNLTMALKADPSQSDLYKTIADIHKKNKDNAAEAEAYKTKLAYDVQANRVNPQDWYYMGFAAYNAGNYEMADSAFTNLTEAYPTYVLGFMMKAHSMAAIDSDLKNESTRDAYAKVIEVIAGLPEEDQPKYKKDLADANYFVASYYFNMKNKAEAKKFVTETLKTDPQHANAKELQRALNQ